jgi:phthiodiolone/phenolphthiodiolone dimycocerosates ketoreductase
MDSILAGRPSVDTYSRVSYRAAVVDRVDSYWVPDHINGQTPRPLWDPKYTAAARLLRSPDAAMEDRPRHAVAVQQSGPRPQAAVISAR